MRLSRIVDHHPSMRHLLSVSSVQCAATALMIVHLKNQV